MASQDQLSLRRGSLSLLLAPLIGGSIQRFDHVAPDGTLTAILRGADSPDVHPLQMGSFPLVPYCNRIRDGRFRFRGKEVSIRPNLAADPSPLHGDGWLKPWTVERAGEDEAELSFLHEPDEWPWRYEARQIFRLEENALTVRLTCRNLSDEPMPCGLGHHPYYPCGPQTELDTAVEDVWTVDEKVLPVERRPATDRYDLNRRLICGQDLDNGFSGWSGEATIRDPALPFVIRLSSSNARFFQVYSPVEGGLFVAEPVGHANAALNEPEESWASLGLEVLAPGEEAALDMRLELTAG